MIKITIVSGAQKGLVLFGSEFKNPQVVFQHLLETAADWKIDFSGASYQEKSCWGACDMFSRCARAFKNGRMVDVNGELYIACDDESIDAITKDLQVVFEKVFHKGWVRVFDDRKNNLMVRTVNAPRGWN